MFEIFEKKVNGVTVGFFIGVRCYPHWNRKRDGGEYTRNIRQGMYFSSEASAQKHWDRMEAKRVTVAPTFESKKILY